IKSAAVSIGPPRSISVRITSDLETRRLRAHRVSRAARFRSSFTVTVGMGNTEILPLPLAVVRHSAPRGLRQGDVARPPEVLPVGDGAFERVPRLRPFAVCAEP